MSQQELHGCTVLVLVVFLTPTAQAGIVITEMHKPMGQRGMFLKVVSALRYIQCSERSHTKCRTRHMKRLMKLLMYNSDYFKTDAVPHGSVRRYSLDF